ncbi:MAG: lecithin retinol acyltransferase family protein [Bacteroidetes bacterium]|nr:lecithin retinol acyltransferase family protein [Bacteroidota bacterium]
MPALKLSAGIFKSLKIEIMNLNTLRSGDLIVRQKGPLSTHYIVYIGWRNGVQVVAENQIGQGVRYTSLTEALAGNKILRFEKFGGSETQRQLVVAKVNELIGKAYDLVVFNCEHFARWIATGKPESKQVKTASGVAIAGGFAMLSSSNKVVRGVGVASIIAGAIGLLSQQR